MRVTLNFQREQALTLPLQYNHILQGFIYHHISPELSAFLHQEGYLYEKRSFKLFCFSNLMGRYRIQNKEEKTIEFSPPFKLVVSSPVERFIQELAETLLKKPEIDLYGQPVLIESIEVHPTPTINGELLVKMLSPMTMSSTLKTADNRTKRYYYSPFEKDFSLLIEANARKKYQAFHKTSADGLKMEVIPERVNKSCEKILNFKDTVIKAWTGSYRLKGSPELLHTAYACGLGGRNSQGFGMMGILPNGRGE